MNGPADTPDAHLRAAAAHRDAGRIEAAVASYEAALRLRPAMPNSWYNLALLLRRCGRFDEAIGAYDRALALGVAGPEEVHLNRAVIYADDLARPDLARPALEAALGIAPDYVPALLNLGNLHEDEGDREGARRLYADARRLAPEASAPLARLIAVSDLEGAEDPLAREAQARMAQGGAAERAEIGYALAGGLDRAGAWDSAFAAAVAANRASRDASGLRYDREAQERLVDRTIAAFPAPGPRTSGDEGPAPIFILGLFRSGSTLAEQILAGGEGLAAGGELAIVPDLVAAMPGYPESAAAASDAAIAQLREAYLERLRAARGTAAFYTDKRPDNFLHVGFIKRMLPGAKIVHTVRNPLDVALSLFFLHLDPAMAYATDLGDIAHWFGQYRRLMAHWQALWPEDVFAFDYDALVADPRPAVAALFRFTGIPHGPGALDYAGTARAVRTASAGQVHQPLYARSSGRWRHYAAQLAPFLDALKGG